MYKRIVPLMGCLLLSGCAGMNSDFDCDAKAQDKCMTMEEANQRARQMSPVTRSTETGPLPSQSLPRLGQAMVPVSPSPVTGVRAATRTPAQVKAGNIASSQISTSPQSAGTRINPLPPSPVNSAQGWSDIGMQQPTRVNATVGRLWVASWIDNNDNFYQPSVVSFVVKDDHWEGQ